MPRVLREAMRAWRIGDPLGQFPVWSAEGARQVSGRWHEAGSDVIYASESYATAMLEKLVHWNGVLPPNQHFIEIHIPAGTSFEVVTPDSIPGWDDAGGEAARLFGRAWYAEGRSALLQDPQSSVADSVGRAGRRLSAPRAISSPMAPACPPAAAKCRGVTSLSARLFTSAPCVTSSRITAT